MIITLNVILTSDCLFQELYFGARYKFNVCVNFHVSLYRNKNQEELGAGKGYQVSQGEQRNNKKHIYLFWRTFKLRNSKINQWELYFFQNNYYT